MDITYPYVVVRYQRDNARANAVVLFYAVSYEQAGYVFQFLIGIEQFDPNAYYAIRETAKLYPSLYVCACGNRRSDLDR